MFCRPKLSGIGFGFSFLFSFLFLFLALVLLPFILFAHLQMEHIPTHTLLFWHPFIRSPRHTSNVSCGFGWLATPFFESSLGNILEKRSKKKSVFFTCVIWLSASLRPLHSFVFASRKVTLYLLKRRKKYPLIGEKDVCTRLWNTLRR